MKKITLYVFVFLLETVGIYAQVGGLSASKLGTLCTEAVPINTIEFEPFFEYASFGVRYFYEIRITICCWK